MLRRSAPAGGPGLAALAALALLAGLPASLSLDTAACSVATNCVDCMTLQQLQHLNCGWSAYSSSGTCADKMEGYMFFASYLCLFSASECSTNCGRNPSPSLSPSHRPASGSSGAGGSGGSGGSGDSGGSGGSGGPI